jgi:hypothetical protein
MLCDNSAIQRNSEAVKYERERWMDVDDGRIWGEV